MNKIDVRYCVSLFQNIEDAGSRRERPPAPGQFFSINTIFLWNGGGKRTFSGTCPLSRFRMVAAQQMKMCGLSTGQNYKVCQDGIKDKINV
jgi:hypothetical protein